MVGSCDVKFPIRLEGLASTHAMFCSVSETTGAPHLGSCTLVGPTGLARNICPWCTIVAVFDKHVCHSPARPLQYEPELFPGLIYRMADPKIVLLIFVSGKVGPAPAAPSCLVGRARISSAPAVAHSSTHPQTSPLPALPALPPGGADGRQEA